MGYFRRQIYRALDGGSGGTDYAAQRKRKQEKEQKAEIEKIARQMVETPAQRLRRERLEAARVIAHEQVLLRTPEGRWQLEQERQRELNAKPLPEEYKGHPFRAARYGWREAKAIRTEINEKAS